MHLYEEHDEEEELAKLEGREPKWVIREREECAKQARAGRALARLLGLAETDFQFAVEKLRGDRAVAVADACARVSGALGEAEMKARDWEYRVFEALRRRPRTSQPMTEACGLIAGLVEG